MTTHEADRPADYDSVRENEELGGNDDPTDEQYDLGTDTDADVRQERDLTPGAKLKASFAGWTPDGTAFFVASNERDARYFDLYRYDSATYERALVYRNEHGHFPKEISGDG